MEEITFQKIISPDNSFYKVLKKLSHSARERRKQGKSILDGVHLLKALADADQEPEKIIIRDGVAQDQEIKECITLFPQIAIVELDARLFDQVSPVETPVGILALIRLPERSLTRYRSSLFLENIQDPGNIGSILRTAAASGIDSVHLSKGCAEAWSPKALRAGMGAHFAIDVIEQCELMEEFEHYDRVVVTALDAKQSVYQIDLTGPIAFIFGNEGSGVSSSLVEKASDSVVIPMPGNMESLNVAAAVAICLFERVRQLA